MSLSTAGVLVPARAVQSTPSPNPSSTPAASFRAELASRTNLASAPTSPREVPARRTALTGAQAAASLAAAWERVHGAPPSPPLLRVLVAQWAHETAHGASMINFNFGGIKGAGPSGLTTTCRTREGSGVTERSIRDRFRAYESASEGAEDYVKLLSARYGDALAQAGRGDSTAFVAALKRKGYFTGSEQAYARSLATMSESIEREGFAAVGAKTSGPLRQTLAPERSASSRAFLPPRAVGDAPDLDPALAVHARSIAESLEGAVARILADPPA